MRACPPMSPSYAIAVWRIAVSQRGTSRAQERRARRGWVSHVVHANESADGRLAHLGPPRSGEPPNFSSSLPSSCSRCAILQTRCAPKSPAATVELAPRPLRPSDSARPYMAIGLQQSRGCREYPGRFTRSPNALPPFPSLRGARLLTSGSPRNQAGGTLTPHPTRRGDVTTPIGLCHAACTGDSLRVRER